MSGLKFTRAVTVQAAAGDNKQRTFSIKAYTGEPMEIYGFEYPVVIDCASLDLTAQTVPALYNHDAWINATVGQVNRLSVRDGGLPPLVAEGVFTPGARPDDVTRDVIAKADNGYIWQASVGGDPATTEKIEAGQTVQLNGRTYHGPVEVARGVAIREISFVVLGGDRRTSTIVARRRNAIKGSTMKFEDYLTSMGWDSEAQATLSEVQKANLLLQYQSENPETEVTANDDENEVTANDDDETKMTANDDDDDDEKLPVNSSAKPTKLTAKKSAKKTDPIQAEQRRIERINKICATAKAKDMRLPNGEKVSIQAHAVESGWTVDQVKLQILRSERATPPPVIHRGQQTMINASVLEAAMLLRCNGKLDSKAYSTAGAQALKLPAWMQADINDPTRNQIMEKAHKISAMSAYDLCREGIQAMQIKGVDMYDREAVIRANFSNASLTNVFTTSINAILLATYTEGPDTTVGWTKEQDVNDYRLQERPGMQKGVALTKQPTGNTADHTTRSDSLESYRVARYSTQFSIDEIDIINDNLGALSDMPVEMGYAALRLRPDLVYAILLANGELTSTARDLFNTTDGNLHSGHTFDASKLSSLISKMLLIRENGVNLNIPPTHLIVPPALYDFARELVASTTRYPAGSTDTIRGTSNPLVDYGLTVVSDARLQNGVTDPDTGTTHAGSSTSWYLGSNRARTIEVGYVRGTGRVPRVRSWTYDKEGKFGVGWDVSMSIGAKALDWKGFQKATT